jgi:hypothetical protein
VITAGLDVGRRHDRTALLVLDGLRLVDCMILENMPLPRSVGPSATACAHAATCEWSRWMRPD